MATAHRRARIARIGYNPREWVRSRMSYLAVLRTSTGEIVDVIQASRKTATSIALRSAQCYVGVPAGPMTLEIFKGNPRKPANSFRRLVERRVVQ